MTVLPVNALTTKPSASKKWRSENRSVGFVLPGF